MPNTIKYSTTGDTQSLKKGNFFIGVGDVGKGPSEISNHYQGITPPTSGYTIYANTSGVLTSIFCANNDFQIINFTKGFSGQNFTGVTQSLNWYSTQNNFACVNRDYERIVTSGLTMLLDAGFTASYSRSGTTWYDLSYSGNNGTLTNGPVYSGTGGGTIVFDGVDDYINCGNSASVQIYQGTISAWIKTSSPGSGYRGIITKQGNYGLFVRDGVLATYDWGNNQDITTGINITDNTWKNVSMTFTTNTGSPSNNAIIYLNGSAVLTTTIKYNVNNVDLQIGNGGDAVQYISGNIAMGSLYNRALSASEILQNYNAQLSRFTPSINSNLVFNLDGANYSALPTNGSTVAGTGSFPITMTNANSSMAWNSSNGGVFRKSTSNTSDLLLGGPNYSSGSQAYTVFMAYKWDGVTAGRLLNANSASPDWLLGLWGDPASRMNIAFNGAFVGSNSTAADTAWHFIWMTDDGLNTTNSTKSYIATNVAPSGTNGTRNASSGFNGLRLFGRYSTATTSSEPVTGDVGFVKVWDGALSLSEIQELHAYYKARFGY